MSSVIGCGNRSICVSLLEYRPKYDPTTCSVSCSLTVGLGEEKGCSPCGENPPPLRGSISCCKGSSVWEWPLHWTLLTPYLIKKQPFPPAEVPQRKPQSPFPLQGSLSSRAGEPGCGCPDPRFLWSFRYAAATRCLPAGTPRGSCHSCWVSATSCSLPEVGLLCRSSCCPEIPAAGPRFPLRPVLPAQPGRHFSA